MDPVEILVRLIEGAVENSAKRRQQQQRPPNLYQSNQQFPQQQQRPMPPQFDPRLALQRARRVVGGRELPSQARARRQQAVSSAVRTAPPAVPPPAIPAKTVSPARQKTPPAPAPVPAQVDARALHRWLTPATLRRQFMLTEVLQPPIALRPNHLE